jgi:hypothetical protein
MEYHMKKLAIAALFAAVSAIASSVAASPETLELDFSLGNHGRLFPAGKDAMRIHYDNGAMDRTAAVAAGMFSGTAVEGANTTIDTRTLFEDALNVLAYCIDIMQLLEASAVYEVEDIDQTAIHIDNSGIRRDFGRMLDFLGAVNTVLQGSDYGFTPDSKNWLRPDSGWMSGAIQVGIWESLYEADDAALSITRTDTDDDQWFWADTSSGKATHDVDMRGLSFLDSAFGLVNSGTGFTPLSANEVLWARNDSGQDLLIDPVPVPAPTTIMLLLGGLGTSIYRRRRQRLGSSLL